ncbi:MAG: hypothetical protein CMH48_03870 [Muricauda sp.]|jgi:hypothetical protein|nr:hypothetical protein [Allomuricauda sp.]MAU27241.1 hypothetical protein [Allomuricauda sp.]MBC29962.1 hypothetical protein [Allomuricauda sp.]|tara:strand:+ start:83556 stop:84632 length:1077 start_codon:yes stop_codon:yes gene_type:complete
MNNIKRTFTSLFLFVAAIAVTHAQDVTTVEASSEDISENLNLEAVASVFGDAKDLEDFEKRLNDPEIQISNLDLNEDGYVDYLRVMETSENDTHLIAIQAVLGEDIYQDVATIEVEKDGDNTRVQVVGDVYLYGPNYIVEPVYVHRPLIFAWFWGPYYRPYRSVFYWGFYPKHFHFWKPFHVHHYHKNVHVHINVKHTYRHVNVRHSKNALQLHSKVRRNDFAIKHPHKAHSVRVAGVNKANGTKKRAVGVNEADGDKYRAAGVNKPDGTKKRVAGVNKADGTKKRAATVKNPDGSRKTVAVKTSSDGTKRGVAVKKDANGNRTVKTGKKTSKGTKKAKKSNRSGSKKKTKTTKKKRG